MGIKVGIIGIGFMGKNHFDFYKKNPKAEVVSIADVDEKKLRGDWNSIAGNIGDNDEGFRDLSGIRTYQNPIDLINDHEVELIDICSPTPFHHSLAMDSISAKKHVLVEKPVARTLEQAKEIANALTNLHEKVFMVAMCIRYWPAYSFAYETYQSGKLGKLLSATFRRLSPDISGNAWQNWFMKHKSSGGALLDLHLHDVDIIHHFFGKPLDVNAFGIRGVRTDSGVDHVLSVFDYGKNCLVYAEGSWNLPKKCTFEMSFKIVGENGAAILDSNGNYIEVYENGTVLKPKLSISTGWEKEIDFCLDKILSNDYSITKDRSWLDSIETIEKIEQKICT